MQDNEYLNTCFTGWQLPLSGGNKTAWEFVFKEVQISEQALYVKTSPT
jgi:hypothetical protein